MNSNEKLQQLQQNIVDKAKELEVAKQQLRDYEDSPERNVYSSLHQAEGILTEKLYAQAHEDCEGSYNCGAESYEQEFSVQGKKYLAIMTFEYNRHDRQYYYIDESEYSYKEIE